MLRTGFRQNSIEVRPRGMFWHRFGMPHQDQIFHFDSAKFPTTLIFLRGSMATTKHNTGNALQSFTGANQNVMSLPELLGAGELPLS